jgi:hypothetical protein
LFAEPENTVDVIDDSGDEARRGTDPPAVEPTPISVPPPTQPLTVPGPSMLVIPEGFGSLPLTTFPLHHVLEDQTGAAKEAMIQSMFLETQSKLAYEAARLAYDASSALRKNVHVSAVVSF